MRVGSVRVDLINDDFEPEVMRLGYQPVKIFQRAEERVHAAIIGDVIAEILHGRSKERRQPDRVDTERCDMVETANDAFKVTDAVAIAVCKAARIDLVDRGTLPPGLTVFSHVGSLAFHRAMGGLIHFMRNRQR